MPLDYGALIPVEPILLIHLAATLFMTGVIWFVQVVHYPLFASVGEDAFPAYQEHHVRRTGWVVGPPMLLEAMTAAALLVDPHPDFPLTWAYANTALLGVVWISTWLGQVPQHNRLLGGFLPPVHRKLVAGNWIRTVAWSLRSLLLLAAPLA